MFISDIYISDIYFWYIYFWYIYFWYIFLIYISDIFISDIYFWYIYFWYIYFWYVYFWSDKNERRLKISIVQVHRVTFEGNYYTSIIIWHTDCSWWRIFWTLLNLQNKSFSSEIVEIFVHIAAQIIITQFPEKSNYYQQNQNCNYYQINHSLSLQWLRSTSIIHQWSSDYRLSDDRWRDEFLISPIFRYGNRGKCREIPPVRLFTSCPSSPIRRGKNNQPISSPSASLASRVSHLPGKSPNYPLELGAPASKNRIYIPRN